MNYNEIKKWLEDNNYQNSGLRTDRNHRIDLYLSDVLHDFAQQQVKNLNIPAVMGSYNDGIFYGIRQCNSEFQVMFQQIYKEFTDLKRIRKKDVEIILSRYANIELGEDINPFLEEVSE